MASLITMDVSDTDKVVRCLKECEEKKIVVDPPHVNFSGWEFQADGERIRFGLAAVKGVGKSAAEAIVEARGDGRFPSLYAFCERVDPKRINRRSLESLLKAGAFDDLGAGRSQLLAVLDQAMEKGHAALKDREGGQASLFDLLGEAEDAGARGESYPDIPPWPSTELLAFEKEALGFYLTGHPLTHFEEMMRRYGIMDTSRLPFAPNGQELMVGGVVTAKKEIISKKGKKERMAFITLTDLKGSVEVVVFANVYREAMSLLEKEDLPILVRGRVDVSEDRVKVLAGEILPLSQAAERLNLTLHLTLRRPLATPEQVGLLGQLLRSHQGKARVRVHVVFPEKSEAIVSLPLTLGVNPDETLVSELEALFGENAVRMETA
jgi:DNA polymerase-3 subunit alpha